MTHPTHPFDDTHNLVVHASTFLSHMQGLRLLQSIGIDTPHSILLTSPHEFSAQTLLKFPGDRLVLKVEDPGIQHKSDVRGVVIVEKTETGVASALHDMFSRFRAPSLQGIILQEFVAYTADPGAEVLVSIRWTQDMGVILSLGPGGTFTEFLGKNLASQQGFLFLSPNLPNFPTSEHPEIPENLIDGAFLQLLTRPFRGQPARTTPRLLGELLYKLSSLASNMPEAITELEINPLLLQRGRWLALDVLVQQGKPVRRLPPPRPLNKLENLLQPRSIALVGVSERHQNPGRTMLQNLLHSGYPASSIFILKAGLEQLDGCRCVPEIKALPEPMDLMLLGVEAAQIPNLVAQCIEHQKAESLVVIPGGFDEKQGTSSVGEAVRQQLWASRETEHRGPVLNGGNCVGVRSRPGGYDALFIPPYKMPKPTTSIPVAFLSQSGAFLVASLARWQGLDPQYAISVGNQMDLTLGDYLTYMGEHCPDIRCFAIYAEGFQPLDGLRFFQAAAAIRASGRHVCLYLAGRTQEGAHATASHTASIAGDYAVAQALAKQTGVLLADTFDDFTDLISVFAQLDNQTVTGLRLAGISNAGFECVAIADRLEHFTLASLTPSTRHSLQTVLEHHRIAGIVDVHNPLDLTPMMGDQGWAEAVQHILNDPNVDVGVISCVPLTPALQTLPQAPDHSENLAATNALASQLIQLRTSTKKAWIAVVDGGEMYSPLVHTLKQHQIPTFRSIDHAVRIFGQYCLARLQSFS